MKRLALALSLIGFASAAAAQPRPFSPALSCGQAASIVRTTGAVVLSTSATTYDRYVRDQTFCPRDQTIDPAWIPTADSLQCFVGYRCVDNDLGLFRR